MEKSNADRIAENLIRAFVQFRRLRTVEQEQKLHSDSQLKHSEIMLLFELNNVEDDYPEGASVSDISGFLCVKAPSITPTIASLEEKNMIERTMDPNDRRIIRVRLKDEGRKVIEQKKQKMAARLKSLVEYLGEEKSQTLVDLMNESCLFLSSQAYKKQFKQ